MPLVKMRILYLGMSGSLASISGAGHSTIFLGYLQVSSRLILRAPISSM